MPRTNTNVKHSNLFLGELFLKFISDNYKKCTSTVKGIMIKDRMRYEEEYFQNAILKIYNLIERKGFKFKNGIHMSGYSFMGYMIQTCKNEHLMNNKHNSLYQRSIDDEQNSLHNSNKEDDKIYLLPENLVYDHVEHLEWIDDHIRVDQKINDVFTYVEEKYNEKDAAYFKFYYKTNLSFQKVSSIVGTTKTRLVNVVYKIKEDVQKHFGYRI